MKKLSTMCVSYIKRLTFLGTILLGGQQLASAQTVNIQSFTDSSFSANCPTPAMVDIQGFGTTTGYNSATDSVDIFISFGDGNDTTFKSPLWGTSPQNFYAWVSHSYLQAGSYTTQMVVTGPGGISDSMAHGPIVVTNACGKVEGYTYVDNNANCIFDSGDDTLKFVPMEVVDAATGDVIIYGWSGHTGYYNMSVPSGVNIELQTVPAGAGLTNTCPASGMYALNVSAGSTNANNFGFECNGSQFDLTTHVSGSGFVPGQVHTMWVSAGNISCMPQSGVVTLTLDPMVSYVSSNSGPAPTSVVGNVITWNTPSMSNTGAYYSWWSQFYASIKITTDTTAVVGDTVCHSISITPTTGDVDVSNNTYAYCAPVLASYDPNMKEVSPIGLNASGDVDPNTTFTYTVHFQNTGNYPAQNIYILDTISNHLDMSTMEILSASHNMNFLDLGNGIVKFQFNDIWLADSVSNEPESHGNVTYRISMKPSLAIGTEITNTAHIYFDYNEAIITNTTLNTIAVVSSVSEVEDISVKLYPNPTTDVLNLEFSEDMDGTISVRDLSGRIIESTNLNGNRVVLSTSAYAKGYYTIDLSGQFIGKFIVK